MQRIPIGSASFAPNTPKEDELLSLSTALLEYPTYGTGDFRPSAIEATGKDGTAAVDLRYRSHKILSGKPPIPGLPATYAAESEADTLEILMEDAHTGLLVTLCYTAFRDCPVITRSVRAENQGDAPVVLERIYSCCADFPTSDYDLVHLWGSWAMERTIERTPPDIFTIPLPLFSEKRRAKKRGKRLVFRSSIQVAFQSKPKSIFSDRPVCSAG